MVIAIARKDIKMDHIVIHAACTSDASLLPCTYIVLKSHGMAQIFGKKVLILYPQSVIEKEMLHLLIAAEYEVALIHDEQKALRALIEYPDSILFVNIEEGMQESQWETFIRDILSNEKTKNVRIGILAYNDDPALKKKYLMDIGVQCGYITLKLGLKESFRIIAKTLEANEAKGRRQYVRVTCGARDRAKFNIKLNGDYLNGTILDISSVGMACTFDTQQDFKPGMVLDDIQLQLRAVRCRVKGKLVGIHKEQDERLVVMFSQEISLRERNKIHQFVYNRLQEMIDAL
jgi:hypothetical protein